MVVRLLQEVTLQDLIRLASVRVIFGMGRENVGYESCKVRGGTGYVPFVEKENRFKYGWRV